MKAALIALALALPLVVSGSGAQDPPSAGGSDRLLQIDAVAVDRNGAFVHDLRPEEVEVWIGGLRIPIEGLVAPTSRDAGRGRRWLTLLIDDVLQQPVGLIRTRDIARRFVRSMADGDRMAVLRLSGSAGTWTDERARLESTIDSILQSVPTFVHPADLGAQVLGAYERIARDVAEVPVRRRVIVSIGTVGLLDRPIPPPMAGRSLRDEWRSAATAMANANVSVYVIDPGGVGAAPVHPTELGLARDTGGEVFVNTNNMQAAVERIMDEALTYYTIRVPDPPRFRSSPLREVEVKSRRDGVTIRARKLIAGGS